MEQLIEYHTALESYKNEKFGLAGLVEEILMKNDESDNIQTEIPETLKRKMNSIEHNTEQMITEVQPINSARVDFAKMFAIGTSSGMLRNLSSIPYHTGCRTDIKRFIQ